MTNDSIKVMYDNIQLKIKNLLTEFSQGQISTEQFNILYDRYSNQLEMAMMAMKGEPGGPLGSDVPTYAIRRATSGKAVGMAIYHHRSGTIIETLGTFEIAPDLISPTLNELSHRIEGHEFIEPILSKLDSGIWLIYMARRFTTVVIVFLNEPALRQVRELERLHHDFEEANHHFLDLVEVDKTKLAKPFLRIVQSKLGGT